MCVKSSYYKEIPIFFESSQRDVNKNPCVFRNSTLNESQGLKDRSGDIRNRKRKERTEMPEDKKDNGRLPVTPEWTLQAIPSAISPSRLIPRMLIDSDNRQTDKKTGACCVTLSTVSVSPAESAVNFFLLERCDPLNGAPHESRA